MAAYEGNGLGTRADLRSGREWYHNEKNPTSLLPARHIIRRDNAKIWNIRSNNPHNQSKESNNFRNETEKTKVFCSFYQNIILNACKIIFNKL